MSASTRTVQRTLGTSQLGGMIVLLAVLAAIVGAMAFGTLGAKPVDVAPAAGYQDPVFSDHGTTKVDTYVSPGGWGGPRLPSATDDSNGGILGPRLQAR